jgi:8-oxo-dGTP diphosphatase
MPVPDKMFVAADSVVFRRGDDGEWDLLLIERGCEPYKGCWALPGGFVELDEDLHTAAMCELFEETSIRVTEMTQLGAWGKPGRDPRGRNIGVAYMATITPEEARLARAGDDAAVAAWHPVSNLPPLAFDHEEIVRCALERL